MKGRDAEKSDFSFKFLKNFLKQNFASSFGCVSARAFGPRFSKFFWSKILLQVLDVCQLGPSALASQKFLKQNFASSLDGCLLGPSALASQNFLKQNFASSFKWMSARAFGPRFLKNLWNKFLLQVFGWMSARAFGPHFSKFFEAEFCFRF